MSHSCEARHTAQRRVEQEVHQTLRSTMKSLVLAAFMLTVGVTLAKNTYTDKWDHINVDDVLESERLLKGYMDCLLEKGRCTPDGKTLKETLPDALENECSKCTQVQKSKSDQVIRHLVNKRPEMWKELSKKYDPNNLYQERYKDKIDSLKGKN